MHRIGVEQATNVQPEQERTDKQPVSKVGDLSAWVYARPMVRDALVDPTA